MLSGESRARSGSARSASIEGAVAVADDDRDASPRPTIRVVSSSRTSGRRQRSGRYTAPSRDRVRVRSPWHRAAGWLFVVIGLIVAALTGLMYMDDDLRLLPGGFSLAYMPAGLPLAAAGAWFLGLFDDVPTVYR